MDLGFRHWTLFAWMLILGTGLAGMAQPPEKKPAKTEPTPEELERRQGAKELAYTFKVGEEIHATAQFVREEKKVVVDRRSVDRKEAEISTISRVMKVSDKGVADLDVKVTRVLFRRTGRLFSTYDSSDSAKRQDSDAWELLTDAHFTCKVDPRGKVTNIQPDQDTADFWKQQPRELRLRFSDDNLKRLLPFAALPENRVRRGTRWETKVEYQDDFGRRDMDLKLYYSGTESLRGRTLEAVKVNGEAKLLEKKPSYELVDQYIEGKMLFDFANGNLSRWNFYEEYLFDKPESDSKEKKADTKKKKKVSGGKGRGGRGGGGSSEGMDDGGELGGGSGGYGGYGGGSGKSGMVGGGPGGQPGGGSGYGQAGKFGPPGSGKESSKKKKEDLEELKNDKSVEIMIETTVRMTYRGQPIATED